MEHKRNVTALRRYLKVQNQKYTVEREEMLHIIESMNGRYTLEDLYEKARKRNAIHAKSTLYRNINLFVDAGFIKEIQLGKGQTVYETNQHEDHEDYLLCVGCGQMSTFKNETIEKTQDQVCQKNNFEPISHLHLVKGFCADCQTTSKS